MCYFSSKMGVPGTVLDARGLKKKRGALFSLASLDPTTAGGNFPASVPGPNSTGGAGPEVAVEMEMELEVWGLVGRWVGEEGAGAGEGARVLEAGGPCEGRHESQEKRRF